MQYIGRILLAILGPVVVAALFVLPVFFLHAGDWLRVAIYLGEIVGVLLIMLWYHKTTDMEFGLNLTGSGSIAIWSAFYMIVRVAVWVLIVPQKRIETNWHELLIQGSFFLLLNAMGEELHFRGLLFAAIRNTKKQQGIYLAAVVSSGIFALAHLVTLSGSGWIWFLLLAGDGLALCAIRIKANSIFWSALVHGLLNIFTGVLFVGASTADDSVVYTYIAAALIIDLLFFVFVVNQAKVLRSRVQHA